MESSVGDGNIWWVMWFNDCRQNKMKSASWAERIFLSFISILSTNRETEKFHKQKSFKCYECLEIDHVLSRTLMKIGSTMHKINKGNFFDAHVAWNCNVVAFQNVQTKEITFNYIFLHLLT